MTGAVDASIGLGLKRIRRTLIHYACGTGLVALFLFLANGLFSVECNGTTTFAIATISLLMLSGLSAFVVFRLLRHDRQTLWTPAAIFPFGTLLFFGFGSASTLFADSATTSYFLAGTYGLDAAGLIKTQLLTATGITVAVVFMVAGMRLRFGGSDMSRGARGTQRQLSLPATAAFFIVTGVVLKYGLILPSKWGIIGVSVPGSVVNMVHLLDIGLAVAMYLAARGSRLWLTIFLVIWPLHLGVSLLELSKRVMMFAILLPAAGAFLAHKSWKRLIPWIALAALTFSALQDVNTTARLSLLQSIGNFREANFNVRVELLHQILTGELDTSNVSSAARATAQVAWLRLNYSGPQLRAMELYDNGRPAESVLPWYTFFIPRILWPDKPEVNRLGQTFNRIVTGNIDATTRVGITVYADGYWTMGWPGLALFSAVMGAILGLLTRISYRCVVKRQFVYLPVVFIAMRMAALGPMGFLQSSFVAALPMVFGFLGMIYLLQTFLQVSQRPDARLTQPLQPPGAMS